MAVDPASAKLTNLYTHLQTLIKKWVYDKTEVDNKLSNKLDKAQTSYKGKNVIVDSSSGNIAFEDKNNHTHSQYLTEHQSLANYVLNSSLGNVAFSNDYDDLDNLPSLGHLAYENDVANYVGAVALSNDYDDLDNKPTIPTTTSELTNNSGFITSSNMPSASSTTPSADTTTGSVGTGTDWARSDHTHPKSSLYAEASHTHSDADITTFGFYGNLPQANYESPSQQQVNFAINSAMGDKENNANKVTSLSSSSTDTQYPSAKCVYDAIENTFNLDTLDCINENFNMISLPHMTLIFDGVDFANGSGNFGYSRYNDIYIDWGDETSIEAYTAENPLNTFSHSYEDGLDTHAIRIYGNISLIGTYCFKECHRLRCVTLPETVTWINTRAFYGCTDLMHINIPKTVTDIGSLSFAGCTNSNFTMFLNWTETDILPFTYAWTGSNIIVPTFSIPYGTTSLYENEGYPTEKLVERSE